MDPVTVATSKVLLEYGLAGVVIILFGAAIFTLWRENKQLREAHLADVRKGTEALLSASQAMEKQSDVISDLQQTLAQLVAEIQARRIR